MCSVNLACTHTVSRALNRKLLCTKENSWQPQLHLRAILIEIHEKAHRIAIILLGSTSQTHLLQPNEWKQNCRRKYVECVMTAIKCQKLTLFQLCSLHFFRFINYLTDRLSGLENALTYTHHTTKHKAIQFWLVVYTVFVSMATKRQQQQVSTNRCFWLYVSQEEKRINELNASTALAYTFSLYFLSRSVYPVVVAITLRL